MRKFAAAFFLAMTAVLGGSATAGVVGSPHDISAQKYTVPWREEEKKNVCNYCHIPHKAKGARLWATPVPSLKGWGKVGPLCYSCHDGVAIVSPDVDASLTAFNPWSHGLSKGKFPAGDDMTQSELPYTNGGPEEQTIECSTCHNPHDNTNRPFLRAALLVICEKCHQHRENSGYNLNNAEGTHPVHKLPKDEVEGASPIDVQEDFKVRFPRPYPQENGKVTEGVHWTLGGHLSEGDEGTIECFTCHSVHGKEGMGPPAARNVFSPDPALKETDEISSPRVQARLVPLFSVDPVLKSSDSFCEGCHRGQRGDKMAQPPFPNPGGTKAPRTYHPADDDVCNGPGRKVEIKQPEGWVFGKGGEVLCTTCHKAHKAIKDAPMLRPAAEADTFCEECHSVTFAHHPSGDMGGLKSRSGKAHASTRQVIIPPTFQGGITYGNPQSGMVYCSTCHRAHNATCPPILTIECADGMCSVCLQCHQKFNPTWQTDDNFKATHFLGDPTQSIMDKVDVRGTVFGTQPDYYDQFPPMYKDAWPDSKLTSDYGPNGTSVTCCSCHSFAVGNITGGEADQSPFAGPILAPGYVQDDLTEGLIERAGSFKEWLEGDVFVVTVGGDRGTEKRVYKYLCTGCHGLTPSTHPNSAAGEGLTHPLMDGDASAITPKDPARITFNKHVNCESCHSAHEADSRGGFYILKFVEPRFANASSALPDPYRIMKKTDIEYAGLCQLCHTKY